MAGKVESLKEYLVKLGWDVDELGLSKLQNGLSKVERSADSIGNKFVKNFAKAGTAVGGFLLTITAGTAKFMSNVATADLATERWARRMWTTEENARSLTTALDAMGASYEDIFYMTPEEYRNMLELKNFSSSLKAPADVEKTLKQIRDINQEINKTKIIFANAAQWIAYYLGQYLGKDFKNAEQAMEEFNNYLVEKLPVVTEKIAKYISWVVRLAKVAIQFIKDMKERLQNIFDKMPSGFKTAALAATAFLGALKMGPLGLFIAGITALLLLLDDYYTYQRGGKSAFDWGNLFGSKDGNNEIISLDYFEQLFGDLGDTKSALGEIKQTIGDIGTAWHNAWTALKDAGFFDTLFGTIFENLNAILELVAGIGNWILVITGNWDKIDKSSMWRSVGQNSYEGNFGSALFDIAKGGAKWLWDTGLFDWIPGSKDIRSNISDQIEAGTYYTNSMSTKNQGQLVGGTTNTTNSNVRNDNRRQTANINVNVKSYGNSDTASQTARGVSKALQDVDVFK